MPHELLLAMISECAVFQVFLSNLSVIFSKILIDTDMRLSDLCLTGSSLKTETVFASIQLSGASPDS